MIKKRCVIYPKDIQNITGRSERYGQVILSKIRIIFRKKPHQFVTVDEFAEFSGIPKDTIESFIH
ncbi:hypothetical protein [Algoriphagus pacificus]|uniref:Uncharacterized protein n=1 Tax=Algoriphagus pacificus TaxID=2811234 RepID=A0ABS3CMM4_9BACT|nr:hypothetical protein [Algoriphagus pacificus]MBN7817495.1 hypothetical protein [Algoriphagus pacificus]